MDRGIVYPGAIPQDTDLLNVNKNAMVALGFLMQAVLGTSVSADGLACTPHSPANLTVNVGPGSIHSLQNIDGTAYGTLAADTTNQIVKQGINPSTVNLSCPAPATTGQSINYLIQAAYQDTDSGPAVLPYYNASNPSVPWSGPNNTGVSQNTVRKGQCLVGVKAGIAAATGSQVTPAPDAGYVGLYVVTVANGQTTITSGNITQLASAPFIPAKLPAMLSTIQSGAVTFAQDTSGAANTIIVALNPIPAALVNGQRVAVKIANSVTGATVMNVNGLGNVAVVTTSGAALTANAMVANGIYTLVYDANGNRWQLQGFTAASATGLIPANNLSDVSNKVTSLNNLLPTQTGKAGQALISDGTNAAWSLQTVVQQQRNQTTATGTTNTVIPLDNTIPQITEGAEFMTQAITPKSATSVLEININFYCGTSPIFAAIGAIFQDAITDAIWAGALENQMNYSNDSGTMVNIRFFVPAGGTTARTYRFRAGPSDASGTFCFNRSSGGALFGGVSYATMSVTEWAQ